MLPGAFGNFKCATNSISKIYSESFSRVEEAVHGNNWRESWYTRNANYEPSGNLLLHNVEDLNYLNSLLPSQEDGY